MSDDPYILLRAWTVGHNAEDETVCLRMATIAGEAIDVLLPAQAAAQMGEALALAAAKVSAPGPLNS